MEEKIGGVAQESGLSRSELGRRWTEGFRGVLGIEGAEEAARAFGEKVVACEGLDAAEGVSVLEKLSAWLGEGGSETSCGRLVPADEAGAEVVTLYGDTTPTTEWRGLARVKGRWTFALGDGRVLVPTPEIV